MTQIKVCGVTRLDQALLMESMGIQYIGFNFVKSSERYIAPEKAQEIIMELNPRTKAVGVFMNHGTRDVQDIIRISGIDTLQFHGQEPPKLLADHNLTKIKVFAIDEKFDFSTLDKYNDVCDYYLFDTKKGTQTGGTGLPFNWELIQNLNFKKPFFLAGGIGLSNCKEAVEQLKPFALDLNSKIEKKPGVKDMERLQLCLDALTIAP